jgi:uncharacterized protein (TIGR00299 family) protein
VTGPRQAWIDASAGVAGDMLLGALVDAGADLRAIRLAVDTVVPGAVRLSSTTVRRAGLRAVKVDVEPLVTEPPHRGWGAIRELLAGTGLPPRVRDRATAVFAALADAEAHVHGISPEDVHFHEVGALDSLADVVGVCAALEDLSVGVLSAGEVALGSGRVSMAHGDVPVPVPAVARLARGWRVRAGGAGELATPTGMAAIRALAGSCEDLPPMRVEAVGVGAGHRDPPGRANVVRVVLGTPATATPPDPPTEPAVLLEANVDDLDPRLWPGVLSALLAAGALDAWLTPVLMKKGRPAHVLHVLCPPDRVQLLQEVALRETTTLGVRSYAVDRRVLDRAWRTVEVDGRPVRVKLGLLAGEVVNAVPEWEDVAAAAAALGRPAKLVLQDAVSLARAAPPAR